MHFARLSSASRESPVSFSLLLFVDATSDFVSSQLVIILALKRVQIELNFSIEKISCITSKDDDFRKIPLKTLALVKYHRKIKTLPELSISLR